MPTIFDFGEWLGDIEVIRLLRVLRHAAIYEAQRGKEKVLLKVAHPGCQDQLRLETRVLVDLLQSQQHPMLPVILPAYQQADLKQRPYGKTVFKDETKYYAVFEYVDGDFLRDMLLKNPQPWYQHAAWLTISLADAIAFMHLKANRLHLNLTPEAVYVRVDKAGIPRPLLLDLGLLSEPQNIDSAWVNQYGVPSYTPPELLARDGAVGYGSDVYSLGLLLYEMLAGHPAFPFEQRKDAEVRQAVIAGLSERLNRTDLAEDIHNTVHLAVARAPEQRQQDVRVFAKLLRTRFGEVPAEKKRSWNRVWLAVGALIFLFIIVWILLLALLG
jgi:serine/threonine protein kinase